MDRTRFTDKVVGSAVECSKQVVVAYKVATLFIYELSSVNISF